MKRSKITLKTKQRKGIKKGNSKYARKYEYLVKHGGWGFDYKEKPWK